jgi:hypothetical protein
VVDFGIALGLAGTLLTSLVLMRTWSGLPSPERVTLRWLVPGAVLAAAGATAGMPGGRELTVACIGSIPVVATVLRFGCSEVVQEPTLVRWGLRGLVGLLATIHVAVAPL